MSPRRARDLDVVAAIAEAQAGLITAGQLREAGISRSTTQYRIRTGGPWSRPLPGTYLVTGGELDRRQRRLAALLYAGRGGVLTGLDALEMHKVQGLKIALTDDVLILVPESGRRSSTRFVAIERTRRAPCRSEIDGLVVASPVRAAVDAGRRMRRKSDVLALLSRIVQGGFATPDSIDAEIRSAHRRSTALLADAMEHINAGTRSAPEAALRELWLTSGMSEPLWNPRLLRPSGEFLASPDAYVPSAGVAVEVDSREFHFAPADWEHTMRRHADLSAHGVVVIHAPPSRIARDGAALMASIASAIHAQEGRPAPRVRVQDGPSAH